MNKILNRDGRINIRLAPGQRAKFIHAMEQEGLNQSELIAHLLENYYGDNLNVLRRFRYNLTKRIRKGINTLYINELQQIKGLIDPVLEKL